MANLLSGASRPRRTPRTAPRSRALWGVPTLPAQPGQDRRRDVRGGARAARSRRSGSPAPIPRSRCPTSALVRAALAARRVRRGAGSLRRHRDRARSPTCCCPRRRWGEKEGTVTNSERRITRVRAAVAPPGEARARLGDRRRLRAAARGAARPRPMPHACSRTRRRARSSTSTARRRAAATSTSPASRYALLEARRAAAVAVIREGAHAGRARLYDGRRVPDAERPRALRRHAPTVAVGRSERRALPAQPQHRAAARPVARHEPHRHASRGSSATRPSRALGMHPDDLAARALRSGDSSRIASRARRADVLPVAGERRTCAPARSTCRCTGAAASCTARASTRSPSPAFDPLSKQPELKHAAVEVTKVDLPYGITAFARLEPGVVDALQPLLERFAYATLVPFGRDERVHRARRPRSRGTRRRNARRARRRARFVAALGSCATTILRTRREAHPLRGGRIAAVRLAGETRAAAWLREVMLRSAADAGLRRLALAPLERLPAAGPPRGAWYATASTSPRRDRSQLAAARPLATCRPGSVRDRMRFVRSRAATLSASNAGARAVRS